MFRKKISHRQYWKEKDCQFFLHRRINVLPPTPQKHLVHSVSHNISYRICSITSLREKGLAMEGFLRLLRLLLLMILFVCNTKNRVVHNASLETRRCKLDDLKIEEREFYTSLMNAIMQGYRACPHCIGNTT